LTNINVATLRPTGRGEQHQTLLWPGISTAKSGSQKYAFRAMPVAVISIELKFTGLIKLLVHL
jgi:hypothetical protein